MHLTVRVQGDDRAEVGTDSSGNVVMKFRELTLILPEVPVADRMVSDVMLAIARRDLGSPLLRDKDMIRWRTHMSERIFKGWVPLDDESSSG